MSPYLDDHTQKRHGCDHDDVTFTWNAQEVRQNTMYSCRSPDCFHQPSGGSEEIVADHL
jgi:hypothetical protein